MENEQEKTGLLQRKSHAALLKLLNNIGVVGAILAAIADLVFVIIMVLGVQIDVDLNAIIIFAVVNALIGILINVLLRFQGQKYAEIENEELCNKYYNKTIKEKKYMSMTTWMALKTVQDVVIKGCTTAFSIFGVIYITIIGSKNPIQILLTIGTLILFACFGLIGMNSAYYRFYNIQVPYMRDKVDNGSIQDNSVDAGSVSRNDNPDSTGVEENKINEEVKLDVNKGREDLSEPSGTSTEESR